MELLEKTHVEMQERLGEAQEHFGEVLERFHREREEWTHEIEKHLTAREEEIGRHLEALEAHMREQLERSGLVANRRNAPRNPSNRNVELVAYMLEASQEASESQLPPTLTPVVDELNDLFVYKSYRLVDTLALRARDGRAAEVSGVLPISSDLQETARLGYEFGFEQVYIDQNGDENFILFDHLRLQIQVPFLLVRGQGVQFRDIGIFSDVDVREGQKVVVGKSNVDGTNNALFLVVTAKVID